MEEVLKLINTKYVSIDNGERVYNMNALNGTLDKLLTKMKELDPLFRKLFERIFFGGSYYDGLKVEKPNEFDIDLVLVLPKQCDSCGRKGCGCVSINPSNKPGWFWFKIKKGFCYQLDKHIEDDFLQTNLILNWLKGLLTKALNYIKEFEIVYIKYYSESGLALTFQLQGHSGPVNVDLVPSFKFGQNDWPQGDYIQNPVAYKGLWEFSLVPKQPNDSPYPGRMWRPSFQAQERDLIKSKEKLKPALRLLKKMRCSLNHSSISSYYLKTIVLLNMQEINIYHNLSYVFMTLLRKYEYSLSQKKIPYYWNNKNNLLDTIKDITIENHFNEIKRKLKKIESQYEENPLIVAAVILTASEYKEFIKEPAIKCLVPNNKPDISKNVETPNQQQSSFSTGWLAAGIGALVLVGAAGVKGYEVWKHRSSNNEERSSSDDNDGDD